MEKQKQEAQIEDEISTMKEVEIQWIKVAKEWKDILTKSKEFRE